LPSHMSAAIQWLSVKRKGNKPVQCGGNSNITEKNIISRPCV
jgi:hypothetical protein